MDLSNYRTSKYFSFNTLSNSITSGKLEMPEGGIKKIQYQLYIVDKKTSTDPSGKAVKPVVIEDSKEIYTINICDMTRIYEYATIDQTEEKIMSEVNSPLSETEQKKHDEYLNKYNELRQEQEKIYNSASKLSEENESEKAQKKALNARAKKMDTEINKYEVFSGFSNQRVKTCEVK